MDGLNMGCSFLNKQKLPIINQRIIFTNTSLFPTRIGWTEPQMALFSKVVQILDSDRLARLSLKDSDNEPVKRRAQVGKFLNI